jgi:hypothetical protein
MTSDNSDLRLEERSDVEKNQQDQELPSVMTSDTDSDLRRPEEVSDVEENQQVQLTSVEECKADAAARKILSLDPNGRGDVGKAAIVEEGTAIKTGDCDDSTCLTTPGDEGGLKPAFPALTTKLCNKRIICWATLFLVVLLAITIPVANTINRSKNNPREQDVLDFLVENEISTSFDLNNIESPQYHAAKWIADYDGMKLGIPQYGEHVVFVERYVMAVLFYALDGNHWKHDLNFLSPNHICTWYAGFTVANEEDSASALGVHGCMKVDNTYLTPFSLYLRK